MIDLEFSEPINPATVIAANVYVRDAANAPVAGTLSLRSGNRVIRFTPTAPLSASNTYNYVYYTNGLLDLQGAAVAGSNFYFYMGTGSDTTSPSVTAIVPTAGASGVGVNGIDPGDVQRGGQPDFGHARDRHDLGRRHTARHDHGAWRRTT